MKFNRKVSLDEAIQEWQSKKRRMGCVSASIWMSKRVNGFKPLRLTRYTINGEIYQHMVVTNGIVIVDLVPHLDAPKSSN